MEQVKYSEIKYLDHQVRNELPPVTNSGMGEHAGLNILKFTEI